MKSEKDSTELGFLANLRKNIRGLVAPSEPEPEAPAMGQSQQIEAENAPQERVNAVGKKIFELQVSDAEAIRPPLPHGFFYPDAQDAADRHAELLRELPPGHPLAGVPLETFAVREQNDDTLFRFRGNPRRFVLVHLTGSGRTEINENYPAILWSGTSEEFENYLVEPDA